MIRFVIPRISYVLKVRLKKISLDSQESSRPIREVSLILNQYDKFFSNLRTTSRNLIQQSNEVTQHQIKGDLRKIFNDHLNVRVVRCLTSSASTGAKKAVLFKLIRD